MGSAQGAQPGGSGRARSGSRTTWGQRRGSMQRRWDAEDNYGGQEIQESVTESLRHRNGLSPSRLSFGSTFNHKTPARSYFQHSLQDSHHSRLDHSSAEKTLCLPAIVPVDITSGASQGVREDTAELASLALSDITSNRSEHSPGRNHAYPASLRNNESHFDSDFDRENPSYRISHESLRPGVIEEVSEPASPMSSLSDQIKRQSTLAELIRRYPSTEASSRDTEDEEALASVGVRPVTIREGIISQPSERTPLLQKQTAYGSIKDLESQKRVGGIESSRRNPIIRQTVDHYMGVGRVVLNPKSWNRQDMWKYAIHQPISLIPSVILGLLLNVLDALSYGKTITRPFAGLLLILTRYDSLSTWRLAFRRPGA